MRLRRIPPAYIINPRISLVKAGLAVPVEHLEAHFLAGDLEETLEGALDRAQDLVPTGLRRDHAGSASCPTPSSPNAPSAVNRARVASTRSS